MPQPGLNYGPAGSGSEPTGQRKQPPQRLHRKAESQRLDPHAAALQASPDDPRGAEVHDPLLDLRIEPAAGDHDLLEHRLGAALLETRDDVNHSHRRLNERSGSAQRRAGIDR